MIFGRFSAFYSQHLVAEPRPLVPGDEIMQLTFAIKIHLGNPKVGDMIRNKRRERRRKYFYEL